MNKSQNNRLMALLTTGAIRFFVILLNISIISGGIIILAGFKSCNTAQTINEQTMTYDDYSTMWKEYNKITNEGKFQDALSFLDKIELKAQQENNDEQLLKSLFARYSVTKLVKEDPIINHILYVEARQKHLGNAGKAILESYLGELYSHYYQNNQYKLRGLTNIDQERSKKIQEWTASQLIDHAGYLYLKSIESHEFTLIENNSFNAIMENLKANGSELQPTIFDVLANRATTYFSTQYSTITQPVYAFVFDQEEAFLGTSIFRSYPFETRDSSSFVYRTIRVFQKLENTRKNSEDKVLLDIIRRRMEFVYRKNVNDNKDKLYIDGLEKLLETYKGTEHSFHVLHDIVSYHIQKGNQFDNTKTEEKNVHFIKAIELLENAKSNYKDKKNIEIINALIHQIKLPELNFNVEIVNLRNTEILSFVKFKNIDQIDLEIYSLSREELFRYYKSNKRDKAPRSKTLVKSASIALPKTTDYANHSTEIILNQLPVGAYVIYMSHPGDGTKSSQLFHISNIGYSNVDNSFLQISDRKEGFPIQAEIREHQFKWNGSDRELIDIGGGPTDKNGTYQLKSNTRRSMIEITTEEDRLFLIDQIGRYNYHNEQKTTESLYCFTDRAIYRPGQKVYFKAIATSQEVGGEPAVITNRNIKIILRDANYQEVFSKEIHTNEFGSIHDDFILPTNLLNGLFNLEFRLNKRNVNNVYIQVEEYKRPKFTIETSPITKAYKLDETISISGTASSFSGSAVDQAKVKYTITRSQPYRWYCRWYNPKPSKVIKVGETTTNAKGIYEIEFVAESDRTVKKSSNPVFSYQAEVTITDFTGETRTETHQITAGTKAYEIEVEQELTLFPNNEKSISISIQNLNGDPVKQDVNVSLERLEEFSQVFIDKYWETPEFHLYKKDEYYRRVPGYPMDKENEAKNLKALEKISSNQLTIDKEHKYDLSTLKNGIYKIIVQHNDAVTATSYVTVINGENSNLPKNIALDLQSIKNKYTAGENVPIDIYSAFSTAHVFFHVSRVIPKEKRTKYKVDGIKRINLNTSKADRGGMSVYVTTFYQNRFFTDKLYINIPYEEKKLKLEWETFRSDLYPGSEEKWRLKITDIKGKPVNAEILASMYDASLDEFISFEWGSFYFNHLQNDINAHAVSYHAGYSQYLGNRAYHQIPLYNIAYPYLLTQVLYGKSNFGGSPRYKMRSQGMEGSPPQPSAAMEVSIEEEASYAMDDSEIDNFAGAKVGDVNLESKKESNKEDSPNETKDQPIRKNLNETVFFSPELRTNAEGETIIEFTMSEALTEWKLQTFAHTKEAKFVLDKQTVTTSKDLMVFPNGPRFFREGDQVSILAKIQNKTEKDFLAKANIKILNALTLEDITELVVIDQAIKDVSITRESSSPIDWQLKIPSGLESISYQVSAKAGDFTDGEENTAIVLTNRKLITESLAITIPPNSTKEVDFEALDKLDKSNTIDPQLMQVSVTSNPSWLAIQSLPYLMEYPYKCTEQVFSRYFGNQLGGYILKQNPLIEEVYQEWRDKDQLMSALRKNEKLKSAVLEMTPWVLDALSEEEQMERMAFLFDVAKIKAESNDDLAILIERQNGGGFSWFPGGRPNWYITQYIVEGFGQMRKMGVLDGKDHRINNLIEKALRFIDEEVIRYEERIKRDSKNESISPIIIHYLYTRSFFPEYSPSPKAQKLIDLYVNLSKKTWLDHTIYSQGQLALYFHRVENTEWANKIMESLRQRTIYKENLGRYWKEVNGYNWYQSNIESQALLIAAFDEISNNREEVDQMKQWLLSNKQTNRWKSTKATTQAVYALVERGTKWINNDKIVTVKVNKKQMSIPTDKMVRASGQYDIKFAKDEVSSDLKALEFTNDNGHTAWASSSFQYWEDLDKIEDYQKTPLQLKRTFFKKVSTQEGIKLIPLDGNEKLSTGDLLTVRIQLIVDRPMEFIHLQDMRASGTEPVNVISTYKWKSSLGYYMETRDAATNFFIDYLPRGEYTIEYDLRAVQPGKYSAGLSTIQSMYAPEFGAHSKGISLQIEK